MRLWGAGISSKAKFLLQTFNLYTKAADKFPRSSAAKIGTTVIFCRALYFIQIAPQAENMSDMSNSIPMVRKKNTLNCHLPGEKRKNQKPKSFLKEDLRVQYLRG